MPISTLQAATPPLLLVIGFTFSSFPILKDFNERAEIMFSFLNAFAGGVFLGSGLLHMLPDANEAWENVTDFEYPIAMLMSGIGFFLTMFLEVFLSSGHEATISNVDTRKTTLGCSYESHAYAVNSSRGNMEHRISGVTALHTPTTLHRRERELLEGFQNNNSPMLNKRGELRVQYYGKLFEEGFKAATLILREQSNSVVLSDIPEIKAEDDNHHFFSAMIFLLLLSVHSFIVGLSLGCTGDESTDTDFGILLFALVIHKAAASLALGISMRKAHLSKKNSLLLLFGFSLSTPSGVGLGILLSNYLGQSATDYMNAFALSLGSGSFIYLAVMENLQEEFVDSQDFQKTKFLFVQLGFGIMAGLAILG